jgi:hypothetical protein
VERSDSNHKELVLFLNSLFEVSDSLNEIYGQLVPFPKLQIAFPFYNDVQGKEASRFGVYPRSIAGVVTINQKV